MEEQREEEEEEELDLALESLWVDVRRVGKEKGIFVVFVIPFGLGFYGGRSWWWWWGDWRGSWSSVKVVVVVGGVRI